MKGVYKVTTTKVNLQDTTHEEQTMAIWQTVGFGNGDWEDGGGYFFNCPSFHSTLSEAQAKMEEYAKDPSYDGAVLIEREHEDYFVREAFGMEGMELRVSPLGVPRVGQLAK